MDVPRVSRVSGGELRETKPTLSEKLAAGSGSSTFIKPNTASPNFKLPAVIGKNKISFFSHSLDRKSNLSLEVPLGIGPTALAPA